VPADCFFGLLGPNGGVFYSARTLDEPWSTLTRLDPIYYLVDATRHGFHRL
jgi:ABC-type polysaccharide/polyol phosphate export permease